MKKTILFLSLTILVILASCGGKKLEGKYKAAFKMNQTNTADSTAVNMANVLLSNAQINMNFKADGNVDYGVKMGELTNMQTYNYEIVGDSLVMKKENTVEKYLIENKDGLISLSSKNATFTLTKEEE